jgi:pyruvate dehydrogenase (quinone)
MPPGRAERQAWEEIQRKTMSALPHFFRGRAAHTVSDVIVDALLDWGVDTIFGLPGDGINGVFEALRKVQDKIRFVQVRHEEAAAFMACAHAKYTGKLGVCIATSGPGAIHLLNGLYDAKMDNQPVLAITGQTYSDLKGSHYQQEVDLLQLFSNVASEYNEQIGNAGQAEMVTDIACRTAIGRRTVTHISIPVDVQDFPAKAKPSKMKPNLQHTSATRTHFTVVPMEGDLREAAGILNAGKKVAMLVGQGALSAREEVIAVAERLGAPVVKALLGKGVIPDDHPLNAGGLGLIGTEAAEDAMDECDTLFMVGTSFPYMAWLPEGRAVRCVQIDIRPERIGLRYPVESGLVGDAKQTLRLLFPMLKKHDRGFLKKTQRRMKEWNDKMRVRGSDMAKPMRPEFVAQTLSELAPRDAIVSCDCGTVTTWLARHFIIRDRQKFSVAGNLATMAPGLPYGIAAAVAYPNRRSIAFVGDGAFTMLMGEFATAVKYNLKLTVVLIKNNTLGQIKWEQMVFLGNPEYQCELHPINFAAYARACGGHGVTIEEPAQLRSTLQQALHSDKPTLVECVVNQFEPPMPAKATLKQGLHLAEALARGEPNRGKIALTIFRDKIKDLEA